MRREHHSLYSPAIGSEGTVIAYGHHGRPLLAFPSERGAAHDYENNGMIGAVSHLIDDGRLKVYCVDSFDAGSWNAHHLSLEQRAREHERYASWIVDQVVPFIHADCDGPLEVMTTGSSFGAYHAANFALKRADLFPLAICLSGVYDVARVGYGERGDAMYFNNPMDYVRHLDGDHLGWLQERVSLVLVAGQGMWEDTTGALESTRAFAGVLAGKGIRHELDIWGHDVPHDWPSWRAQIAHHLPRFV
ncbi:MAG TPA: alpha/beta hydrolase-fold protein [Actinomycetota bacterium]|nr:alpha/beta hydrolase-fold protein [Actinomycetota bacterium]